MKIVKRVITIMLVGIMVLFVGCTKADFEDTNVAEARKAVSEFYRWHLVIVPDEYIVFNKELSSSSTYVFDVYLDPVKAYPNIYDTEDNVEILDETLYVKCYSPGVYEVYNVHNENVFTYFDRATITQQTDQSDEGTVSVKTTAEKIKKR